jgi:hypothetical protein
MQTVTIEIKNEKVLRLLRELESLQLIRFRPEPTPARVDWVGKYKGAMAKQPFDQVEAQLNELRAGWE